MGMREHLHMENTPIWVAREEAFSTVVFGGEFIILNFNEHY